MKTKKIVDIPYTAITKLRFPPWIYDMSNWKDFGVEVYLSKRHESIKREKEIFIHVKLLMDVDGKMYVMPLEYVKEFVKDFGFQGAKRVTTYMCISKTNQLDNPQNYIRGLIR